jgi:hypothetical protein
VNRKVRGPRSQQSRTFRYLGYITWTVTDGRIGGGDEGDDNRMAYRKGRITIRLPCTSTQLNMHFNSGVGSPSYALNVTQVIERHSELGERIWGLMRDGGEKSLHEMISKRELSIYSVLRKDVREMNLFFVRERQWYLLLVRSS